MKIEFDKTQTEVEGHVQQIADISISLVSSASVVICTKYVLNTKQKMY